MTEIIIFFVIGCLGGVLSGLLGIGGGVVLIPLLTYWGGLDINSAAAVSMIFIIFASISGIIGHNRMGNINRQIGIVMGLSSVIGSFIAAYFSGLISEMALQTVFMLVIIFAVVMLLFKEREHDGEKQVEIKTIPTVMIGLLKGALTGMLGVGGGFIIVPLMVYLLSLPIHHAVGTSLVVNFLSALAGIAGKSAGVSLSLGPAWWVIVGAIPSAQVGCWLASQTRPYLMRYLLLVLLVVIFISMSYDILSSIN